MPLADRCAGRFVVGIDRSPAGPHRRPLPGQPGQHRRHDDPDHGGDDSDDPASGLPAGPVGQQVVELPERGVLQAEGGLLQRVLVGDQVGHRPLRRRGEQRGGRRDRVHGGAEVVQRPGQPRAERAAVGLRERLEQAAGQVGLVGGDPVAGGRELGPGRLPAAVREQHGQVRVTTGVDEDLGDSKQAGIHHVVRIDRRVENQPGIVADGPGEFQQLGVHVAVLGVRRGWGPGRHGQPLLHQLADVGPPVGGAQLAAEPGVGLVDRGDRRPDRGRVDGPPADGRGLRLGGGAEQPGQRLEVGHPAPLVGGERPRAAGARPHLGEQHRQRHQHGNGHGNRRRDPGGPPARYGRGGAQGHQSFLLLPRVVLLGRAEPDSAHSIRLSAQRGPDPG